MHNVYEALGDAAFISHKEKMGSNFSTEIAESYLRMVREQSLNSYKVLQHYPLLPTSVSSTAV